MQVRCEILGWVGGVVVVVVVGVGVVLVVVGGGVLVWIPHFNLPWEAPLA